MKWFLVFIAISNGHTNMIVADDMPFDTNARQCGALLKSIWTGPLTKAVPIRRPVPGTMSLAIFNTITEGSH